MSIATIAELRWTPCLVCPRAGRAHVVHHADALKGQLTGLPFSAKTECRAAQAHARMDLGGGLGYRAALVVVRARSNAGTRLAAGPAQRVAREAGLMPCAHEDAPALDMRLDGGHVGIVGTHAGRGAREQLSRALGRLRTEGATSSIILSCSTCHRPRHEWAVICGSGSAVADVQLQSALCGTSERAVTNSIQTVER